MNNEIKPCPFCGGAAAFGIAECRGQFIECRDCKATTNLRYACGDDPKLLLVAQWNRRPGTVSPSFDRCEHQIQERQIALAECMGMKADLYRVDMGVLGEIYVKPEVASERFKQLKRDRAPVKAVYPMYQGAAVPNEANAINPAEGHQP